VYEAKSHSPYLFGHPSRFYPLEFNLLVSLFSDFFVRSIFVARVLDFDLASDFRNELSRNIKRKKCIQVRHKQNLTKSLNSFVFPLPASFRVKATLKRKKEKE